MSSASVARAAQLAPGGGGVTRQLSQVRTAWGDRLRSLQTQSGSGGRKVQVSIGARQSQSMMHGPYGMRHMNN